MGEKTRSEKYTYSDGTDGDGSLTQLKTGSGHKINYTYDALKHLKNASVVNSSNVELFKTACSYRTVSGNQSSAQVEFRNVRRSSDNELLEGKKYDYDSVGNIIQISQSTGDYYPLVKYEYDSQNQLISEIYYNGEGSANTNITSAYYYTYDTAGNLQRVEEGAVGTDGTITKTVIQTYTYSTGGWKDLLTKVNSNPIAYEGQTYDADTNTVSGTAISGNPTSYPVNGAIYNLTWENGRQLSSIKNSNAARPLLSRKTYYSYNANGIRTEKKVPRGKTAYTVHSYITQNGKVVRETIAGSTAKVLDFIYDESGRSFALIYTDGTGDPETYYYILNQQGDVVKLIQRKETVVDGETTVSYPEAASYTYDAWGKILDATGSMAAINPLRYRGYYYDTETGFYYLQSRYYDPVNHRFINADTYTTTDKTDAISCNMFAYCNNNPVMRLDSSGKISFAFSLGFTFNLFGFGGSISISLVSTDNDLGMQYSYYLSDDKDTSTQTIGFDVGPCVGVQITEKESIKELEGLMRATGGDAVFGCDILTDTNGKYVGWAIGSSLISNNMHSTISQTKTIWKVKRWDWIDAVFDLLGVKLQ